MDRVIGRVFLVQAMLGIRFNSGIGAWVNDGGSVTCLMNYLLHIFSGELFSQMNNLCSDEYLCFEILVCESGVSLQVPHRTLTVPIIMDLIRV